MKAGAADMKTGPADMKTGPAFATPYFPLQLGLQWKYRQTLFDGTIGTGCYDDGSTLTLQIGDFSSGVYSMQYQPACFYATIGYRVNGNLVTESTSGGTYTAFDFPPVLNKTWAAGGVSGATYIWDMHYDTYTVAAGTFTDCFRWKQQGYETWQIVCNGVGAVLSAGHSFQDYRWELTGKNF